MTWNWCSPSISSEHWVCVCVISNLYFCSILLVHCALNTPNELLYTLLDQFTSPHPLLFCHRCKHTSESIYHIIFPKRVYTHSDLRKLIVAQAGKATLPENKRHDYITHERKSMVWNGTRLIKHVNMIKTVSGIVSIVSDRVSIASSEVTAMSDRVSARKLLQNDTTTILE